MRQAHWAAILGIVGAMALGVPNARADFISSVPGAANYRVLFGGAGTSTSRTLSISTSTINAGNVGVGGSGNVTSTNSSVTGTLNFSAGNTGQYIHTGPVASATYGGTQGTAVTAAISAAMNATTGLSKTLGAETGTNIAISGTETITASTGKLDANGNYVFNVTSYSETSATNVVTISGANGHAVIFNFAVATNIALGGTVKLVGLTTDQVLWNFTGSTSSTGPSQTVSLGSSGSGAFRGDILAPNDVISLANANLDGRVWGGNSQDVTIVSSVVQAPEPASLLMLTTALVGFGAVRRRRRSKS